MKKTYIIPATDITPCEAFQLMAGSGEKASLNLNGETPIKNNGETGDMSDFTNRTNLWEED